MMHDIGVVLFTFLGCAIIFLALRWVRHASIGGAGIACQPSEVLGLIAFDLRGEVADSVLTATFRDRTLSIRPTLTGYDVTLATGAGAFSLTGNDAIARLANASASSDAKGVLANLIAGDPDWRAMHRIFSAHDIRFERGCVRASVAFGGGVLGPRAEAERLGRFLDRLSHVAAAVGSLFVLRPRENVESRCPYCHDDFSGEGETVDCGRCGALHHEECWSEHGKCAVFACVPTRGVGLLGGA